MLSLTGIKIVQAGAGFYKCRTGGVCFSKPSQVAKLFGGQSRMEITPYQTVVLPVQ
jgi:hypothetical protein